MSVLKTVLARWTDAIRRRGTSPGQPGDAGPPETVFVLGNQKSGTTAIAALLAECAGQPFTSDVLYTYRTRLKDFVDGRRTISELAQKHPEWGQAGVVKDNDFTFLYPSVAEQFPRAGVVFVVRDPRQNIRSILNRLDLPGDLSALTDEQYAQVKARAAGWLPILTGSSFGQKGGHYIDVLADRWVRANEVYLGAADRMTLARYEEFDAAKRPFIEGLTRTLGYDVVTDISPSQDRQYQPLGDRSVTPEEFFGANLARLERRCAPLMSALGYAASGGGAA